MTQEERRLFLIEKLLDEQPQYRGMEIPQSAQEQKLLLRCLFNIRLPRPADETFVRVQDAYLQAETAEKGIISLIDLAPIREGIFLWRGDITTLKCDAIVNAANSALLGCFCPNHGCIDNCIHTYAGVQLRNFCDELMKRQGHEEPTGQAKITPAFNLPSRYVLHTVGPIVQGRVTQKDQELLASCYRSCLDIAERHEVHSIAFCCISTGEFHFPNLLAARIAVKTVCEHEAVRKQKMKVIFNVFKEQDEDIYRRILTKN